MKVTGKISHIIDEDIEKVTLRHRPPHIWVIVADKRIARIFCKYGQKLELIGEASPTKTERKNGMPDDSMGRVISHGGTVRHKLEPHEMPGHHDAILFAHDLSVWLENAAKNGLYDRLVLIAAPKTLGYLRERLGQAVQSRIIAEVNKDLTKLNEKALQKQLKEIVWF